MARALALVAILGVGKVDSVVTNVRQVDFENFTYRVWGDHDVQVRRGMGVRQKDADPADPVVASIQTAYGDLTGDGRMRRSSSSGSWRAGVVSFRRDLSIWSRTAPFNCSRDSREAVGPRTGSGKSRSSIRS